MPAYHETHDAPHCPTCDCGVESLSRQGGDSRCPHCDDTGDVHTADGEWHGVCSCPAGDKIGKDAPPKTRASEAGDCDEDDDAERCEGGDPECGPVEFHDVEGVPLCRGCWESLLIDMDTIAAAPAPGGG